MTTTKNIARPFGDCLTWVEETTPMFRFCCWADEKAAETGRGAWGYISCIAFRLSQVDIWTVIMHLVLIMGIACIVAFTVLNAANGYQTIDTIKAFLQAILGHLTHVQTVINGI